MVRTAWSRRVGLLLVLSLMSAGLPRWELHAHVAVDHGHAHAGVLAEHDEPTPPPGSDPADVVAHAHDAVSLSAALHVVEPLQFQAIPPLVWTPPFHLAPATSAAGPPPQRPPIV